MELKNLFEDLKYVNSMGIYSLTIKGTKNCWICYSSNIAGALSRHLNSNMFIPEIEFELLEIVTDSFKLRPRCQYFKDLYSSNGYVILNPKRVCNLKLLIQPIDDFRFTGRVKDLFKVSVVSLGYKEVIVGIFESYDDVEVFCAENYKSSNVYDIIKSSNELTREYLNVKKE